MPGSPPINVAEPATSPPPSARSNSAMPVFSREGSAMSLASPCSATARPPDCRLCRALKTVSPASSTRLFHSPHSSHCPCQRKDTDPHCWQTYFFFTFAIAPALSEHMRNRSEEHTSELQSLMRISYAVFCLKKNTSKNLSKQQTNK